MAFDFKKEYKEFYMPKNRPEIITVPKANYIAVRGSGDPNEAGGAYQQAIASLCPEARVQGRACTLFVPLAEEGWMDGPIVEGIASRYLGDLFSLERPDRPDTLVLGCTHFPLFREALRHVVGDDVRIVDSAETAAVAVENRLRELGLLRGEDAPGSHRFMTTDNVLRFIRTGSLFLGHPLKSAEVSLVDLS